MALGRFLQADSIVPNPANPQSLNRYSYTLGNPLRYTDPSGHKPVPPWLDAIGVRIEGTLTPIPDIPIGIDFNLDCVLNLNDPVTGKRPTDIQTMLSTLEERFDIFFSINAQAVSEGAGISGGILLFHDLPRNDELHGWQFEVQGTAKSPLGLEAEICYSPPLPDSNGQDSWMVYFGAGAGTEISLGLAGGHNWKITDPVREIAQWLTDYYRQYESKRGLE